MKKTILAFVSAITIGLQLFTASTVRASGLLQISDNIDVEYILTSPPGQTTYQVTGDGTPLAVVEQAFTGTCATEGDEDTVTNDCEYATLKVRVYNPDTEPRQFYACGSVWMTSDGDPLEEEFTAHWTDYMGDVVDEFLDNAWIKMPYTKCQRFTVGGEAFSDILLEAWNMETLSPFNFRTMQPEDLNFVYYYKMYISWSPITTDATCGLNAEELGTDTFEIDPEVFDPLGGEGPANPDQIYATTTGMYYKLRVHGGPWWSWGGQDPDLGFFFYYTETEISWDNETWMPLESSPDGDCVQSETDGYTGYIFQALSDTLYVRVLDREGQYGGNTTWWDDNDDDIDDPHPFYYDVTTVAIGETAPCESQYSFDESGDLIGHTGVPSNNPAGVLANNMDIPLVIGDWYMVRWTSGYWQDNDDVDQTALEYGYDQTAWADLSEGGAGVWCATGDGLQVLFQATGENVYLRVNNVLGTFYDNTGTPYYDLYHVTFVRTPATCETQYQIGGLLQHGVVDSEKGGGERFAFIATRPDQSVWGLPDGMEYGGWYVVDTTDGPWQEFSIDGNNPWQYDMAVSDDGGSTWQALEDWDYPVCNFEIDAVGHRRLIFQMPFSGAVDWKFRVNDTEGVFIGNNGSMEWDLYGATATTSDPQPNGQCDYSYDVGSPVALGEVQGNDEDGVPLLGMTPGSIYVLKVIGTGYGWKEDVTASEQYDAELSVNNGSTWNDLGAWNGALCSHTDGDDTYVFLTAAQNYNYVLRVNSTTFSNNTGELGYAVYPAQVGQSIVNTCFDGWSLQILNEFEWIGPLGVGPRDEAGELLQPDSARYEEFEGYVTDANGDPVWVDGGLVVGREYAIEVPVSHERWNDGEGNRNRPDIAITNDDGVTWHELNAATPIINCASYELIGSVYKARFTMLEGQVWKVRVNDEADQFADNSGSLAYKFYALCDGQACTASLPNDGTTGDGTYTGNATIQNGGNVCNLPVMRPGPLSISELTNLGTYLGSWVQYINLSISRYMAWCPIHTNTFLAFLNSFKTREPLASVVEWMDNLSRIKDEVESYEWGEGSGQDFSLFSIESKADLDNLINTRFMPSGNNSVWDGGEAVSFGQGTGLPDAYYSCGNALTARIPSKLKMGVCFVSGYFIETSASFWIQMVIDIGAFFMALRLLKNALQETIYMMTGVRPWAARGDTHDGFVKIVEAIEREQDIAERASSHGARPSLVRKFYNSRKS